MRRLFHHVTRQDGPVEACTFFRLTLEEEKRIPEELEKFTQDVEQIKRLLADCELSSNPGSRKQAVALINSIVEPIKQLTGKDRASAIAVKRVRAEFTNQFDRARTVHPGCL
eukprot:TRINITY_DN8919_c0_g1_i1.p1 TRINITY_DN8919_c0_g1~~TRINITY_DN8919_c0_g1_i1.p1  ORF type:complete len:112 (+),score=7.88 TRINITY_DN8919_c0_g1_i1:145-480(+)